MEDPDVWPDAWPDAWIKAVAPATGLTIAEEWRPGVCQFLGIAAEMAAMVQSVPLDDAELALAPVFLLPGAPEE